MSAVFPHFTVTKDKTALFVESYISLNREVMLGSTINHHLYSYSGKLAGKSFTGTEICLNDFILSDFQ